MATVRRMCACMCACMHVCRIVSSYLIHNGYCATAEAFAHCTGQSFDEELVSIRNRQSMHSLHSLHCIHCLAFKCIHCLVFTAFTALYSLHSLPYIHCHCLGILCLGIHCIHCIRFTAFTALHSLHSLPCILCLAFTAFTFLHSLHSLSYIQCLDTEVDIILMHCRDTEVDIIRSYWRGDRDDSAAVPGSVGPEPQPSLLPQVSPVHRDGQRYGAVCHPALRRGHPQALPVYAGPRGRTAPGR